MIFFIFLFFRKIEKFASIFYPESGFTGMSLIIQRSFIYKFYLIKIGPLQVQLSLLAWKKKRTTCPFLAGNPNPEYLDAYIRKLFFLYDNSPFVFRIFITLILYSLPFTSTISPIIIFFAAFTFSVKSRWGHVKERPDFE